MREHEQRVKDLVLKEYTQFKHVYNKYSMRVLLVGYVHGLTDLGLYLFDAGEVTSYIEYLLEREEN